MVASTAAFEAALRGSSLLAGTACAGIFGNATAGGRGCPVTAAGVGAAALLAESLHSLAAIDLGALMGAAYLPYGGLAIDASALPSVARVADAGVLLGVVGWATETLGASVKDGMDMPGEVASAMVAFSGVATAVGVPAVVGEIAPLIWTFEALASKVGVVSDVLSLVATLRSLIETGVADMLAGDIKGVVTTVKAAVAGADAGLARVTETLTGPAAHARLAVFSLRAMLAVAADAASVSKASVFNSTGAASAIAAFSSAFGPFIDPLRASFVGPTELSNLAVAAKAAAAALQVRPRAWAYEFPYVRTMRLMHIRICSLAAARASRRFCALRWRPSPWTAPCVTSPRRSRSLRRRCPRRST